MSLKLESECSESRVTHLPARVPHPSESWRPGERGFRTHPIRRATLKMISAARNAAEKNFLRDNSSVGSRGNAAVCQIKCKTRGNCQRERVRSVRRGGAWRRD